ncbi:MAG: SMC-Scp complex subunit ScpB [Bacteroidetes bacterium]|nr:SMC-Scp complex subunit ScpB [Bacteroidota bacterium]
MDKLQQHIESLIFASDHPITIEEIQDCMEAVVEIKFAEEEIKEAIDALMAKYQDDTFALEVVPIANGYQFLSKGAFHNTVGIFLKQTTKKRLSRAALETLSIIAYKQPVTKSELEGIRGVSCDYSIQKLLEKELVSILGRSDGPGRPLLYGTSEKFMDYFGLRDMRDLPKPKDFKMPDSEIGEQAPIEEDVAQENQEEE